MINVYRNFWVLIDLIFTIKDIKTPKHGDFDKNNVDDTGLIKMLLSGKEDSVNMLCQAFEKMAVVIEEQNDVQINQVVILLLSLIFFEIC